VDAFKMKMKEIMEKIRETQTMNIENENKTTEEEEIVN
jgi:hypothetical protein